MAAAPEANTSSVLNNTVIHYANGSAALPAGSDPAIRRAAEQIKALPAGSVVQIAGHTDNTGNPEANMRLSQHRAEVVKEALVREGVNPAMLTARGYGQSRPVASNDHPDGRAQNRRIEFTVASRSTTTAGG
jgi:OOP family OmpA-OmpF porin